jgi:hypothetical protein
MFQPRQKSKLEERRLEALSDIVGERVNVELTAQRPRSPTDTLDNALLQTVLTRLADIEASAKNTTRIEDFDDLTDDAEIQGQFSAYFYPVTDIYDESEIVIDVIEGWGVPKAAIKKLRDLLTSKFANAAADPASARSALRLLFEERDSWADYVDEYEDTLRPWARWLFVASVLLPLLSTLAFHFAVRFAPLLVLGLMCAGAAGSCVSVASKMPALDVSLSGELDAYGRRILGRISIGVIASVIGSASLAWLPFSFEKQTFADVLNALVTGTATGITTLIAVGFPMLWGFSERALASFEQRILGEQTKLQKP